MWESIELTVVNNGKHARMVVTENTQAFIYIYCCLGFRGSKWVEVTAFGIPTNMRLGGELSEDKWRVDAAEELPIQLVRSTGQHFRHLSYQRSSSKTRYLPHDLLGSPQKTLSHNTPDPRNARAPEVRPGMGQIVGEVAAMALRCLTNAILDTVLAKGTCRFPERL